MGYVSGEVSECTALLVAEQASKLQMVMPTCTLILVDWHFTMLNNDWRIAVCLYVCMSM